MIDPAGYLEVKTAFSRVRELPAAERDGYLSALERRAPDVASEVRSLLEFDRSADDLLSRGAEVVIGADAGASEPLPAGGRVASRYEILDLRATGGMGEVYEAFDHLLGTRVALKRLRYPSLQSKRRLIEEVLHARRVSHPAVCRVFDIGEADEGLFLTMEFIPGDDLKDRLIRRGAMTGPQVLQLARRLLRGLEAAHEAGVVHRDLKPANVLFGADGEAVLTDFGIAVSMSRAESSGMVGTPGYLAPETVPPRPRFSDRSDLYGLGLVLREALCGRPVFFAADRSELFAALRHPSLAPIESLFDDLDPRLARVIDWSLEPNWRRRAPSARQMLAILDSDPAEVPAAPARPLVLGRFGEISVIADRLGRRRRICRAVDRMTQRVVAVKTYHEPLRNAGFLRRIDPARLAGHPNLLPILDVQPSLDSTLVASPLLEGAQPLPDWSAGRTLAVRCNVLAQMYDGLAYLHGRLEFHGNLKSSNVLVVDGRTVLTDPRSWQPRTNQESHAGSASPFLPAAAQADLDAALDVARSALLGELGRGGSRRAASSVLEELEGSARDWVPVAANEAARVLRRHAGGRGELAEPPRDLRMFESRPCVARDAELARLRGWLDDARTGLGKVVRIVGESGVGKTRILEELRRIAWRSDTLVAQGQARWGRSEAYFAWSEVIRRLGLEVELDGEEVTVLEAIDPDLGTRMGRSVATGQARDRPNQDQLFPVVLDLFGRMQTPTLVLLEDLHWADGGSLELLHWIGQRDLRCKILIVASFRPEETPHALSFSALESLALEPLDEDASHELASSVLDQRRLTPETKRRLSRESEGNPLLLLESLREMVEWSGSSGLEAAALEMPEPTPAVRDVLLRRLETLREDVLWLLARAAVIGREVDLEILALLAGSQMSTDAMDLALETALNAWVLVRLDNDVLRFRHDKLREILVERTPEDEVASLHAALAVILDGQGRPAALVAFHALESGDAASALDACRAAAEQAMEAGAYLDAGRWFEHSIRLHEELGRPASRRGALRRRRAMCFYAVGQIPRARRCLELAVAELGSPVPRTSIGRASRLAGDLLRLWPAVRSLRKAMAEGEPAYDPQLAEAANAFRLLSEACWFEFDAVAMFSHALRSLHLASRTVAPSAASTCAAMLAFLVDRLPLLEARSLIDVALELLDRGPRRADDVMTLGGIAAIKMSRGDWDEARMHLDRALDIGTASGNERRWAQVAAYRCLLATLLGDWRDTRHRADELCESGRRRGDVQVEAWGLTYSAEVALVQRRYERARQDAGRAHELISGVDEPERLRAEGQLAFASARAGDVEQARHWIRSLEATFDGRVIALHTLTTAVHFSSATLELLERGIDDPEHQAAVERSLSALSSFCRAYPICRPYRYLARARLARIRGCFGVARKHLARAGRSADKLAFRAAQDSVDGERRRLESIRS